MQGFLIISWEKTGNQSFWIPGEVWLQSWNIGGGGAWMEGEWGGGYIKKKLKLIYFWGIKKKEEKKIFWKKNFEKKFFFSLRKKW